MTSSSKAMDKKLSGLVRKSVNTTQKELEAIKAKMIDGQWTDEGILYIVETLRAGFDAELIRIPNDAAEIIEQLQAKVKALEEAADTKKQLAEKLSDLSNDKHKFLLNVAETIKDEDDLTEYCFNCLLPLHGAEEWYAVWRLNDGERAKVIQPNECRNQHYNTAGNPIIASLESSKS